MIHVGAVIDTLVTALAAQPGWRRSTTAGPSTDILVLDTVEAWTMEAVADQWVTVGWPGGAPDSPVSVAQIDVTWMSMGGVGSWRGDGVIPIRVCAQRGDGMISAARASSQVMLDAVMAALRADLTVGGLARVVAPGRVEWSVMMLESGAASIIDVDLSVMREG